MKEPKWYKIISLSNWAEEDFIKIFELVRVAMYWVPQKLPQIYTMIAYICMGNVVWFAVTYETLCKADQDIFLPMQQMKKKSWKFIPAIKEISRPSVKRSYLFLFREREKMAHIYTIYIHYCMSKCLHPIYVVTCYVKRIKTSCNWFFLLVLRSLECQLQCI